MQTETPSTHRSPRRRDRLLAGLAVVLLAAAGTAAALQLGSRQPPADDVVGHPMVDTDVPTGTALCAVVSSPETLVQREVAFVGSVTAIDGDAITFAVEEVFRGDLGETVTLGGGEFLATPNPDNVNPVTVGGRFLVAGDGGFAWGCGFTHLYGEDVATTWRAAFAD